MQDVVSALEDRGFAVQVPAYEIHPFLWVIVGGDSQIVFLPVKKAVGY